MTDKDAKSLPESILRKVLSLRNEGISQDIPIEPVLLFVKLSDSNAVSLERVLKLISNEIFPFKGEVIEVFQNTVVLGFDVFNHAGNEEENAVIISWNLKSKFDFVDALFISRKKGLFRFVTLKGREFLLFDSPAYKEYLFNIPLFREGVFIDENMYSYLYHNVVIEVVNDRLLKVKNIRNDFIMRGVPDFIGKNPFYSIKAISKSNFFTVNGAGGSGKSRVVLNYLLSGDFDVISVIKLRPHMVFQPLSAIQELYRSLLFYFEENKELDVYDFLSGVLSDKRKKAFFFENAMYFDEESREFLRKLTKMSNINNAVFFFEGAYVTDSESPLDIPEFSITQAISLFKGLCDGRRLDRKIIDMINTLDVTNYYMVYDLYNMLSLKKYLITGEDTVYLSPAARTFPDNLKVDVLYKILFESLSKGEAKELMYIALNGGSAYIDKVLIEHIIRLLRHGILRVKNNTVEIVSSELTERFLKWTPGDGILDMLHSRLQDKEPALKANVLMLANAKRGAFRELSKYRDTLEGHNKTKIKIIEELLRLEPIDRERVQLLFELSAYYEEDGERDRALSYLSEALKIAKSVKDNELIAKVLYSLGRLYFRLGQNGSALINLKNALKFAKEGNSAEIEKKVLFYMLKLYKERKEWEKLEDILDNLETHSLSEQERAGYLYEKGKYYYSLGKINKAHGYFEEAYKYAVDLNDKNFLALIMTALAEVELSFKQLKTAKKYVEDALALSPEDKKGILVLAKVDFLEGRVQDAIGKLEVMVKDEKPQQDILVELANQYAYSGRYREAINLLNMVDSDMLFKEVALKKARYLLRLGKYNEAYNMVKIVQNKELEEEFYLFLLGRDYAPEEKTSYIEKVMAFTSPGKNENLDFPKKVDYDYIDAKWMVAFNKAVRELMTGNYERSYDMMDKIENMYFKATLALNIAKYLIDRGGDGDYYIKVAGEYAEKEEYLEILAWIYILLKKTDRVFDIMRDMFGENFELRDNYLQARKLLFDIFRKEG